MKMGLGQLQLSPDVFWNMTAKEFAMCSDGYFDKAMFLQEESWKRTIAQINIHLPKNKKINPNRVSRKKGKPKLPTHEETLAVIKKFGNGNSES